MSDLFLDLRNKPRVVDFLADTADYATAKDRTSAEKLVLRYQEESHVPTDALAAAARTLAIVTFSARYAVNRFFETEGTDVEWKGVLSAIRPSTAHLLKRVRASSGAASLDAVLAHTDADSALTDDDRAEIEHIRRQLRVEHWKQHAKALAVLVTEGSAELAALRKRLDALRELAAAMPSGLQDEVFSKIARYEDRLLYAGERVQQLTLDEEIRYYTEQKLASPLDE